MKKPVLIFYAITTILLILVVLLGESPVVSYIEVLYVVFTFAESYYVLQNYDFDHGIPIYTSFFKLVNTITVLVFPIVTLVCHILLHAYIYNHIRGLNQRDKRLKYDYTVNNVIAGPFLLKLFASFLGPFLYVCITALGTLRIRQKLDKVDKLDVLWIVVLSDIVVFIIMFTTLQSVAFLIYMIMLIIFEFTPVEKKL